MGLYPVIGVLISLEALIDKNNWNEGTKLDLYGICSLWPRFSLPCPIRDVCGVEWALRRKYIIIFLGRRKAIRKG